MIFFVHLDLFTRIIGLLFKLQQELLIGRKQLPMASTMILSMRMGKVLIVFAPGCKATFNNECQVVQIFVVNM